MILTVVTLGILSFGLIIGLIYNYLLMYTSFFKNKRIRHQTLPEALSKAEFYKRLPLISINILTLYLLSIVGLYLGQGLFEMQWSGIGIFVLHFFAILFIDDLMFYLVHRTLHENKYLNQKIHSIHHRSVQPFPLDFIYAHPIEWLSGYAGAFSAIILINIFGTVDVYAFWLWGLFRSLHELDIHSGVKSVISRYIPLLAGTEHHDMHHLKSKGNYASTLVLWDKIFGTGIR